MEQENKLDGKIHDSKKESVIVFKTSDYDLDRDERVAKFKDYELILCEKCNQKIDKFWFRCLDCCNKETSKEERCRMWFGKCKECFQVCTGPNSCSSCGS